MRFDRDGRTAREEMTMKSPGPRRLFVSLAILSMTLAYVGAIYSAPPPRTEARPVALQRVPPGAVILPPGTRGLFGAPQVATPVAPWSLAKQPDRPTDRCLIPAPEIDARFVVPLPARVYDERLVLKPGVIGLPVNPRLVLRAR
jgi:hypothetical protein